MAKQPTAVNQYADFVAFYLGIEGDKEKRRLAIALQDAADHIVSNEYHRAGRKVSPFALWRRADFDPNDTKLVPAFRPLSVLIMKGLVYVLSPEEVALLRALLVRHDPYDTKQYDTPMERKKVTGPLRFQVMVRDNFACQGCGNTPSPENNNVVLRVDHIVPVSKGGKTTLDNLQTLCHRCNHGKRDKIVASMIDDNLLYQPTNDAFHPYAEQTDDIFVRVQKPLTKWQALVKAVFRIMFDRK